MTNIIKLPKPPTKVFVPHGIKHELNSNKNTKTPSSLNIRFLVEVHEQVLINEMSSR